MMGPLFEDDSGQGDIHLRISLMTVILSTAVLLVVGVISGLVPAMPSLETRSSGGATLRIISFNFDSWQRRSRLHFSGCTN